MQFRTEDIKVTPEEISSCSDLDLIMNWKYLIDGKITEVDNSLALLEIKEIESPGYIDNVRLLKMKSYRRVIGFLSHRLQGRAGELKKLKAGDRYNRLDKFNFEFVNVAKELLPAETFALIIEKATELSKSK